MYIQSPKAVRARFADITLKSIMPLCVMHICVMHICVLHICIILFSCGGGAGRDDAAPASSPVPAATGSSTSRLEQVGSVIYEIHTFYYDPADPNGVTANGQTVYTLNLPSGFPAVSAQAIVVAGGGGGGWSTDQGDGGGGGGAGGLIYNTAFQLSAAAPVTVGSGGTGGGANQSGENGKDSALGTLTAIGGGGGAKAGSSVALEMQGRSGGSSGGGGAGGSYNGGSAEPYQWDSSAGKGSQGYGGGGPGSFDQKDAGGGGGGANGAGGTGNGATGASGAGGAALVISNIPAIGTLSLSKGGDGGTSFGNGQPITNDPADPTLYGEGGAAGGAGTGTIAQRSGKSGKEGIVIVWWEYTGAP